MDSTKSSSSGAAIAERSRRRVFFPPPVAWVVLAISLLASFGGWSIARRHARLEAKKDFDEATMAITSLLRERMQIYQNVLHGAVGLFAASRSVERAEWREYLRSISIEQRFPGIDAVGFVACVPRGQLEGFLEETRVDEAPRFTVKDSGTNDILMVVKFMEPEEQHRQMLGWNLAMDAERRTVAEKARDSGKVGLSGKIMIRDELRVEKPGCLMMLPVYRHGLPVGTVSQRQAAIEGWVFASFVMSQLMERVMEKGDLGMHVQVFDVGVDGVETLVFDNAPELSAKPAGGARFSEVVATSFSGRAWNVAFESKPAFEAAMGLGFSAWVGAGGGLASVLLFGIAWSLGSTRERALAMASEMTAALRETNRRLETEVQERQRSEAALQHSESLYHSLVESLPLSITRTDLEGRLVFANERYCRQHGKGLSALLGTTDADLFLPDLAARRREAALKVIESGSPLEVVEERLNPDGSKQYTQAIRSPLYDGSNKVVGVLGIFWDVTASKRAEAELKHERFLLQTLMDKLPDRIYFKDEQSRFMRSSRALLEMFGLERQEDAMGRSDFDFFSEEHARQAYEDEQRLMLKGESFNNEEKETWPDGSVTWVMSTKMPLRNEQGRIVGTFGISRDITDRKRAEEAMREAKEGAEQANRAKSQFLASMSHELRTPLNSVIGFANILLKNRAGNLGADELNFLARILANGKHLLALINQILDLSKIEAHKTELQLAPLVLSELVRETVAQQEGLLRDKNVRLLVDLPERVAPMMADAEKLKQVVINLIGNALKFTERGSVTVRIVTNPENHLPIRLDVIDTGIGIAKDKQALIFQAFQQAEVGTARKYGGTGLGLTISQALCQLMGYRIEVQSYVGRGSTFSVCLTSNKEAPGRIAPAPAPRNPTTPADVGGEKGKLVLVIDDELDSRTLLSHMVKEFGCPVIAANSGEQGVRMAQEYRPSLITVDLMMPQLDGWQVIRALKSDPELRDIPVVVVSIVAGESRGGIIGAVDVLQKPVIREDLLTVLRRAMLVEKPRILIVDDDADDRRVLEGYLEGESCECRQASDGGEALRLMETFMPDVILLDLMMPGMDGMAFLGKIRSEPRYQWVPVVVVTAKELTMAEAERLRHTAQDVVKKGDVFEADLRRVLRRHLQSGEPRNKRAQA